MERDQINWSFNDSEVSNWEDDLLRDLAASRKRED